MSRSDKPEVYTDLAPYLIVEGATDTIKRFRYEKVRRMCE